MLNSIAKLIYVVVFSAILTLRLGAASPSSPVFSTVATFTGMNGANSVSGLTAGSNGVLFGTTNSGGLYGYGTVFNLTPGVGGAFTLATLYSFTGFADGSNPQAGLALGKGGVFYGTTEFGGDYGVGTVFALQPPAVGGGSWTEIVLHSFAGGNDGEFPYAGLVVGSDKVLYGVTNNGGASGNGTVFQLIPGTSEASSVETVLYAFAGNSDGGNPEGNLLIGKSGVLFGTTFAGGLGIVFELIPPSVQGGTWTKKTIHSFQGGSDGSNPQSGLIAAPSGVLFGTTYLGGTANTTGHGTVYEMIPPTAAGGAWTETVIHSFASPNDGLYAESSLTFGKGGVLYGTTNGGGLDGSQSTGSVFELTPPVSSGAPWTETILETFIGPNGSAADAPLLSYGGALYSTTRYGGAAGNYGTVFALTF